MLAAHHRAVASAVTCCGPAPTSRHPRGLLTSRSGALRRGRGSGKHVAWASGEDRFAHVGEGPDPRVRGGGRHIVPAIRSTRTSNPRFPRETAPYDVASNVPQALACHLIQRVSSLACYDDDVASIVWAALVLGDLAIGAEVGAHTRSR